MALEYSLEGNKDLLLNDKVVSPELPSFVVELPSNGVFYKNRQKSIKCTNLNIGQVRQLESADKIKDRSNREREIANIIGRSIGDFNVFDLTYPDFVFLLYWMRLNSFKNTPYTINWSYAPEGQEEVKQCISLIKTSNFDIKSCEVMASPEYKWKTVRDYIDILALPEETDQKYGEYAAILEGKDLQEKIKKLDNLDYDELIRVKKHINDFNHGVSEYVKVRDEEVADSPWFNLELSVSIADFFP